MRFLHTTHGAGALAAGILLWANVAGGGCPGQFSPGKVFSVGQNRGMCAVADLDGDGNLDLSTGINALLGDGAGGFGMPFLLAANPNQSVFDAVLEDFDGDGRMDAALAALERADIAVRFGRARQLPTDDLFEPPLLVPCAPAPWHLACGDIDGNGTLDIVAASLNLPQISILLNNGDRTFRTVTYEGMLQLTQALALGDFDGDGHLDIASAWTRYATLLFGNGDGTFGAPISTQLFPERPILFLHRFKSTDFNGDGRSDLVVCADVGLEVYPGASITRDAGLVVEAAVKLELDGIGRFVELGDLSCDGRLDLAVLADAERSTVRVWCADTPTPEAPVAFTRGALSSPTIASTMLVPALGDVNGDGALDVVLVNENSTQGQVLFGTERCTLKTPGDANGDGTVNIADAVAILSHLFKAVPAPCPSVIEVNGDGAVNIADAIFLLGYLFAHGQEPAGSPRPCTGA